MNIWKTIIELIQLCEEENESEQNLEKRVVYLLDSIAFQMHSYNPKEEFNGIQIPENDYPAIRKNIESRFPNWGYYNIPGDVSLKISETDLQVGDAIDDMTDIINDLKLVMWSYNNEDEDTAIWHLCDSYFGNWRWHIRNLQAYIHCLENEI